MRNHTMLKLKLAKPMLVALAACAASVAFNGVVFADDAETKALQDQMRAMQQQMQELQKKLDALTQQQANQPPAVQAVPPAASGVGPSVAKEAPKEPKEPKFEKFLSGFYGTLDVSFDDTTKGINGLVAYHYALIDPNNPNSGSQIDPTNPNPKGGPVGRVGYMPAFSTNKSVIGYRGSHSLAGSDTDFIYQIETQPSVTSAPGLNTSQYQQSNVVKGAIGYGDTFLGFANPGWGKIKVGTTYSPYKKSTDRM